MRVGFSDRFNPHTGEQTVRGRFEVDDYTGNYKLKADAMPMRFDSRKREIRVTNSGMLDIPYSQHGQRECDRLRPGQSVRVAAPEAGGDG